MTHARFEGGPIVATLSVALTFGVAAVLHRYAPETYEQVVQEDRFLEWATFWGFFVASLLYGRAALQVVRATRRLPWFEIGLAAFCFLVAGEEISWGQRVLGYAAPGYFLEENFQQELNVHNVVDSGVRQVAVHVILWGYGVLLSLAGIVRPVSERLTRLGITPPPVQLTFSFILTSAIYACYPWSHTGEWVECAMALCFLFAALEYTATREPLLTGTMTLVAVGILASVTTGLLKVVVPDDPRLIKMAEAELSALARDFLGPNLHTRCNIHKRLYTFAREYGQTYVFDGEFAQTALRSGDTKRARFALDPWNSAYWIRHTCENGREAVFVYSFGPNRRRDSSDWALAGDDIGVDLTNR